MNIIVLDTETTSLDKPFCYNIGYVIADLESAEKLVERNFVVEQVWHNLPLFQSAYYADKRCIYVEEMRKRITIMDKWGYIMRQISRDLKTYNVEHAYAYNSSFDDRVLTFNNDWFKTINPFDTIPFHDLWAMAQCTIVDDEYKAYCDEHEFYTETGNYKTSAEVMTRYISGNEEFIEEHTALSDSRIEFDLLIEMVHNRGANPTYDYPLTKCITREQKNPIKILLDGEVVVDTEYRKIWKKKDMSVVRITT